MAHRRRVLRIEYVIALIAVTVASLLFLLKVKNYPADASYNDVVIACTLWTVLWFGLVFLHGLVTDFICRAFIKQEVCLLRETVEKTPVPAAACPLRLWLKKHKKQVLLSLRCGLLVVAVVLIIFGALHGGMADVLGKAINICTECIGLG